MMLIVASLHLSGFFDLITRLVIEHLKPQQLLPGVIFTSGILSAFLVNDVVCLFLAPGCYSTSASECASIRFPTCWRWRRRLTSDRSRPSLAIRKTCSLDRRRGSAIGIFWHSLGPVAFVGLFIDWALLYWLEVRGARVAAVAGGYARDRGASPRASGLGP